MLVITIMDILCVFIIGCIVGGVIIGYIALKRGV